MTYRKRLEDAKKSVDKLKGEKHQDPNVEHVKALSYSDLLHAELDRYEDCTCTKELDTVKEVLGQALNLLDLFSLFSRCIKMDIPMDLSDLEQKLEDSVLGDLAFLRSKIGVIKFVVQITHLNPQDARELVDKHWDKHIRPL